MKDIAENLELIKAEYVKDYIIMVHFNDGISKEVDFYPFLNKNRNPMNKKYLDVIKFKNFEVKHNALSWNDYEMCFHIDSLKSGLRKHTLLT